MGDVVEGQFVSGKTKERPMASQFDNMVAAFIYNLVVYEVPAHVVGKCIARIIEDAESDVKKAYGHEHVEYANNVAGILTEDQDESNSRA